MALSFVKDEKDIRALRNLIKRENSSARIIAKVERHEAIKNLEGIINETDGVMVARGDMGVEIPFEDVPIVQKKILRMCSKSGKPVIIATQMLESMIQNYRPTRAEVSDVSNAVGGYADAVMLSAESAVGAYPVKAVEAMTRTALTMEKYQFENHEILPWWPPVEECRIVTHGITYTANQIAEVLKADAIIVFTESGVTARQISRPRPCIPIFAFTSNEQVARQMTISRAVIPFLITKANVKKRPLDYIFTLLKNNKLIKKGERVILTAGVPMQGTGNTNMIRVETVY